jgi:NAD(P)-dependent dehydrogenase (short-subunit alcohol dehydrogenase family)
MAKKYFILFLFVSLFSLEVVSQEQKSISANKNQEPTIDGLAIYPNPTNSGKIYITSKAALDTVTLGLAREVAKEGVQVIGVAPGGVATELHAQAGGPERIERFSVITPIGRAAHSHEVADVVVWALLDAPDYVTGTTLDIAGGL